MKFGRGGFRSHSVGMLAVGLSVYIQVCGEKLNSEGTWLSGKGLEC